MGAWMFVFSECGVLSGRSVCEGPISLPEESYRLCVCVCGSLTVPRCNNNPLYLQ